MTKIKNASQQKRDLLQNGLFFALLAVTGCFLFWKCRYGFGNIDESFYLTIPYRLYLGDALFLEEWHLSQMAGVLTFPFVAAYIGLTGSVEGIILFMRYVCTLVQCLTAVFLYLRLKKINWTGAFVAAISFVLYTPFGIMALSYNSMGILFLLVSQVIMLTAREHLTVQYVVAGLAFAAAVLCCPYLLLVYILYLTVVAIIYFRQRGTDPISQDSPFSVKSAVCFTAGAAFAAVVFVAFVLSRGSLKSIIEAFSYIFDDPEHGPKPLWELTSNFFAYINFVNSWSYRIYPLLGALWVLCLLDKKRIAHRLLYTAVLICCLFALLFAHYKLNNYINHLMWSVNIAAPFLMLLSGDMRIRKIFTLVWVPGILYAFCLNWTSNQQFFAISSAASVATVGSLLMLVLFACELIADYDNLLAKGFVVCCFGLLFVAQITTQAILRYESVFWEQGGMQSLTVEADTGIEKGVIMSEDAFAEYQKGLNVIDKVSAYHKEKVLYLSTNTWYYLVDKQKMSTFSAWISGVNEHSLYRLTGYYEINPEKMPDIVFAEHEYEEVAKAFCDQFGYEIQLIEEGFLLLPQ